MSPAIAEVKKITLGNRLAVNTVLQPFQLIAEHSEAVDLKIVFPFPGSSGTGVCSFAYIIPSGLLACRKLDACSGNVFLHQGMRGWLADEAEMLGSPR